MPLRNRVLPSGEIVADPARGLFTGNRGALAVAPGVLSGRRWTTKAWICCELHWRGRRRPLMQPGTWTELFFLDEAVALSAGHRPCGYCRREDYARFRAAWASAFGGAVKAPEMDAALHRARTGERERLSLSELPEGSFVLGPDGPALLWRRKAVRYTPEGYRGTVTLPGEVEVLTPGPMRKVLAAGYRPIAHPSADEAIRHS